MSKLYPVGVQNFEKVILGGYEYVDKTALIYQLFNTGSYYFSESSATLRKKPAIVDP